MVALASLIAGFCCGMSECADEVAARSDRIESKVGSGRVTVEGVEGVEGVDDGSPDAGAGFGSRYG